MYPTKFEGFNKFVSCSLLSVITSSLDVSSPLREKFETCAKLEFCKPNIESSKIEQ